MLFFEKFGKKCLHIVVVASFVTQAEPALSNIANYDLNGCISKMGQRKNIGRLGVAVLDLDKSSRYLYNGDQYFPMQSVFKAPLAFAVLELVDAGQMSLTEKIVMKPEDLSVLYSPIADHYSGHPETFTVSDLIKKAVQESDNTAADLLLSRMGGPRVVTVALKRHGIEGISVDRYERQLQPGILGLPPFEPGQKIDRLEWQKAKEQATGPAAREAFTRYIRSLDRHDTSTPSGMLTFLQKLYLGQLLSPSSTKYLLEVMAGTKTGVHRLVAGLPAGSVLAHKTGSGPDLSGINGGTNDIGIATLPSGRHFAIAVFLSGSRLTEPERDAVIRRVCQCAVDHI